MTISHALARSFIAPLFISGGIEAITHAEAKADDAEKLARLLADRGMKVEPVRLMRINGALQVVAGSLLVLGRLPRVASAALAVSVVPTTLAGHRFWEEKDPAKRAEQRIHLMKNVAVLGGLILAATDLDGVPSLKWRARKAARRASSSIGSMTTSVTEHLSHSPSIGDRAGDLGERASALGERAISAVTPILEKAVEVAGNSGKVVGDRASRVGEAVSARASSALRAV